MNEKGNILIPKRVGVTFFQYCFNQLIIFVIFYLWQENRKSLRYVRRMPQRTPPTHILMSFLLVVLKTPKALLNINVSKIS